MATPSILTLDMNAQAAIHAQRESVIKDPIRTAETLGSICKKCTVMSNDAFPKMTAIFDEIKEKFSTGSAFDAQLGNLALNAVIDKTFKVIGSNQEARYNTEIEKINTVVLGLPVVETGSIGLEHTFSTSEFAAGVKERLESLKFGPKESSHNISLHDAEDRVIELASFIRDQAAAASFTGLDIGKMISVMSGKGASAVDGQPVAVSLFTDLVAEQSLLEQIVRFKNTGDAKHLDKIIEKAGADPVILDSIIKEKPALIPVIIQHYDDKGYDKTELMEIVAGDFVSASSDEGRGASEDTRSVSSYEAAGSEEEWSASGSEDEEEVAAPLDRAE